MLTSNQNVILFNEWFNEWFNDRFNKYLMNDLFRKLRGKKVAQMLTFNQNVIFNDWFNEWFN